MSSDYYKTTCHKCGDNIFVPTWDWHEFTYCYTCAMSKLGETTSATKRVEKDV